MKTFSSLRDAKKNPRGVKGAIPSHASRERNRSTSKYLEKRGLVKTIQSPREIALMVSRSLSSDEERKQQERRGTKLLQEMEDPIKVISGGVRKTWKKTHTLG